MSQGFGKMTLEAFSAELASAAPTPGGGTGAAAVGALGAALVRMLCLLTVGKPKYAEHDRLLTAIAETCEEARLDFLALADEDAKAYDAVGAAMKRPKATPEEQAARETAMQSALKGACEVPLKVMERALEVIGIAKNAVQVGNKNAVSDGAAGAAFCRSALTVAAYNVRINLVAIKDVTFVKDMRTRLDEMLYMGTAVAQEIDSIVIDLWAPKPPPRPAPPA